MASYRVYKKGSGEVSVTAVVRKKGHPVMSMTFTEPTKTRAMSEAKAWAAETEKDIYHHRIKSPLAAKHKLTDFFSAYFNHIELTSRKKKSTVRNEQYSRTQIERLVGSDTLLTDISTATIAGFRDSRIREGVGASKIRSEIALISCLFKYAIQEKGLNIENPVGMGKLWRPPAPKNKIDFLTEDEIHRFLVECRSSRNKKLAAYVTVLINTGMRPGEAALLKVSDVNIESKSIWLGTTKNGESRTIPLTATAFHEIMPHVINRHPEEYVFHKGKVLPELYQQKPAQMFRVPFDQAKARAGIDRITRHGMRHTAATHMLAAKVPLRTIAEVLGHKTLQMAMLYTHPDETELRKAVDTLDHLIRRESS